MSRTAEKQRGGPGDRWGRLSGAMRPPGRPFSRVFCVAGQAWRGVAPTAVSGWVRRPLPVSQRKAWTR